jgi:hypothetical protein
MSDTQTAAPSTDPGNMAALTAQLNDLQRRKQQQTQPIIASLQADRDKTQALAKQEEARPDVTATPPPEVPQADPVRGFASAASVFAMLASALTHTPMTAAMSSMASAINARNQNDMTDYEKHYDQWKKQTDEALKLDEAHRAKVNEALDLMRTDAAAGQAMLNAVDTEYGDEKGTALALAQMWTQRAQLDTSRAAAAAQMKRTQQEIDENAPGAFVGASLASALKRQQAAQQSGNPQAISQTTQEVQNLEQLKRNLTGGGNVSVTPYTGPDGKGYLLHRTPDGNTMWTDMAGNPVKPPDSVTHVAAAAGASGLTPEARKAAAESYILTGQIPGGSRNKADVEAIQNEAAELRANKGLSAGDTVANQAGFKADTSSLTNLTKLSDASDAQQTAATKELDLVERNIPAAAENISSIAIDKWVQTGQTQFGDTEIPKYQAALISALDEYAKIINGSTGATGSTDSARAQAATIIPPGATSDQIKEIISTIKQGMQYKTESYRAQIDAIRERIGAGGGGSATTTAPATPTSTGEQPPIPNAKKAPDGKWYVPDPARPGKYLMVQ